MLSNPFPHLYSCYGCRGPMQFPSSLSSSSSCSPPCLWLLHPGLAEFPRAKNIKHQIFHAQRLLVPPRSSLAVLYSRVLQPGLERWSHGWEDGTRDGAEQEDLVDEGRCQRSREGEDGIWATRDCSCPGPGLRQEAGPCLGCRMSHRRDG